VLRNPVVLTLFAAALLVSGAAAAQEPAAPAAPAEAGHARETKLTLDLGFVNASGNTRVTTLSLAEQLAVKAARWEFREVGSVVYGRTGDSTTAEQLKLDTRVELRLVAVLFFFLGGTYERNRFAGIARRFEEYGGFAVKIIDRPADLLTLEAGSSLNQDQTTANHSDNFAALKAGLLYRHNFTKAAYFQQTVETIPSLENSNDLRVNSETALVAPLAGRVAIKLGYVVKYDKRPEPGFQTSDRVLTTAVQIVF